MSLEFIVTEVTTNHHIGKLEFSFFNFGTIYSDWKDFKFPSKRLNEKREQELREKLHDDSILQNSKFNAISRIGNSKIFQVIGDYSLNKHIKKHYDSYLINTDGPTQARWTYGVCGQKVLIDEIIANSMSELKEFQKEYDKLCHDIDNATKVFYDESHTDYTKRALISYQTRTRNVIHNIDFDSDFKSDFSKKTYSKFIPENIILKRKKLSDKLNKIRRDIESIGNNRIEYVEKKDIHRMILDDPNKYFEFKRCLTPDEIMKQKWAFVDIEVPQFKTNSLDVSWVGIAYYEDNKVRYEIHTSHLGELSVPNNCDLIYHKDVEDLVIGVKNSIKKENPMFTNAFNARYDWIKLREAGNFKIGEEKTHPIFKSTAKFAERIGIKGRIGTDFYKWSKIVFPHKINRKLTTVASELLEERIKKSITYDEMAKLDIEYSNGNIDSGQKILDYLMQDIDVLPRILQSKEFQTTLTESEFLLNLFGIPFDKSLDAKNCAKDAQAKQFFEIKGTYPSIFGKDFSKVSSRKQKFVNKLINVDSKIGIHEHVLKLYIPYADYIRKAIAYPGRFEKGNNFFRNKYKTIKNCIVTDHFRQFLLSQYAEGFAEDMIVSYIESQEKIKKRENVSKKSKLTLDQMHQLYHRVKKGINKNEFFDFVKQNLDKDRVYDLAHETLKKQLDNFNRKTLSQTRIWKYSPEDIKKDILDRDEASIKKTLKEALDAEVDVRNQYRFFEGRYGLSIHEFEGLLKSKLQKLNEFLGRKDIEVLHKEGRYVYVKAKESAIDGSPLIHIDTINKLAITKKRAYYEEYGYNHGISIKDEATWIHSRAEMQLYDALIKNILNNDFETAINDSYEILKKVNNDEFVIDDLVKIGKTTLKRKAKKNGRKSPYQYYDINDVQGLMNVIELDDKNYIIKFKPNKKAKLLIKGEFDGNEDGLLDILHEKYSHWYKPTNKKDRFTDVIEIYPIDDTHKIDHDMQFYKNNINEHAYFLIDLILKESPRQYINMPPEMKNDFLKWGIIKKEIIQLEFDL